jgi:hypothetical protein
MPRRALATSLLLAFLTVGAASASHNGNHGAGNNGSGQGNGEAPDSVAISGCTIDQGLFPIPYADALARVPAPFTPATFMEGYGVPRDPALLQGEMDIGFLTCAGGSSGLGANAQTIVAIILTTPPPEFRSPDITTYMFVLGTATPTDTLRLWFEQWGMPTEYGGMARLALGPTDGFANALSATSGSLWMQVPTGPAPLDRPMEGFRFIYHDGDGWASMDGLVEPHLVTLGPAQWSATGTGWLANLPTSQPGIAGTVSHPGWDITLRHVEFP